MFTTNLQIHIVTCCIHPRIRHTSRIPYLFHTFSDFVVYEVKTLVYDKRGYPVFAVQPGHHRAQQIDRQLALQTAEKENSDRIPFPLTFHPHNHAVKSIIFKNFKLLPNDSETEYYLWVLSISEYYLFGTSTNFIQTWKKHRQLFDQRFISNQWQPGSFKCVRSRCKSCPFIHNVEKISGPKRSIKITGHFTCASDNVIYCITCTYCKKLYIDERGRRLGDRFREHLRDVKRDDRDASKPVARHFNLPNYSSAPYASLWAFPTSRQFGKPKNSRTKTFVQISTLNPHGISERFLFN